MKEYIVHNKVLPVPSFFQVFNYGGGFQDKTREVVYAELTERVPALFNYFYINNEYKHDFQSHYFDCLDDYESFGDAMSDIRGKMILEDNSKYSLYPITDYDFSSRVLLLDSGASNIVKVIAQNTHYDTGLFCEALFDHMRKYYDFADKYKFDIIVGFDLGGKYTFKAGERENESLKEFYKSLDVDEINYSLLVSAADYLGAKPDYYPKVLATVHGKTPQDYRKYVQKIKSITSYEFWGYALGGVASAKGIDEKWLDDIDFTGTNKQLMKNAAISARATKIVHDEVGDKPIHVLGCGGYANIPMNYYFGATSFDAASPSRRVGDGNNLSAEYLYCVSYPRKAKFSKMLIGGYSTKGIKLPEDLDYKTIRDLPDNLTLCGCAACRYYLYVSKLKELYAQKEIDAEANYLSRQLMNTHSINQHTNICRKVTQYSSIEEYCNNNQTQLNKSIFKVYKQICR